MNKAFSILAFILTAWFVAPNTFAQQTSQDDLKKQIGTIIVTPGNGPLLAVADFQPRAAGVDQAVATFNEVLLNDLRFAGIANLVGKSLYPKTKLPDPASLKPEEWTNDPVKADYVAFGSLTSATQAQGFLYDVKTNSQLLNASLSGSDARDLAHQFADQIVKLLTGQDGIATSKLAYINSREVFLMDYDGYGARQFSHDGSIALFPSLAPDGNRLAYVSYRSGHPNVVVRGIDGLIIGSTQFKATTSSPNIAPGGQLVFSSSKDNDSMELYVANDDGSNPRRLTRTKNAVNISPRWNPKTGREIAFISDRGGAPQIYVIGADGTNERALLSLGGQMDSPAWSPDGRYIAFTWNGGGAFNIYVADVASGQVLRLTGDGRNENPTWSPDSRHLAFQSNRTGRWEIWAMHIDGSEQRQLTRSGGRSPSWAK
ncbi:MAG: PD40 domain-containing protein [Acidobacteria bacterium]|nr:PD40 domain-containing protein [Acidobacteriota bacterium]MBI3426781.1 PD40 domain-containing protein [Acidobacteriota bacterium]